jgi:PAP2 superfamily
MDHIAGTQGRGERCAVVMCGRGERGSQLMDKPVADPAGARPAWWHRIVVPGPRPRGLLELVVIAAMFGAYKLGRIVAAKHVGTAFNNAYVVWDLERILRLPDELSVQTLMLKSTLLIKSANVYYVAVHFPATAAFLIWLYLRRPGDYLWIRRTLALTTASGLLVHLAIPVAPPRMLGPLGFVDTADVYGPAVYGPPAQNSLADQYAAMPSLHIGWAIMVAIGIIATTRTRWRWLAIAHPVITTLVVIGTANHFWLDGMVAAGLLAVSLVVVRSYSDLHDLRIEVPDYVPVLDRPSERDRAARGAEPADPPARPSTVEVPARPVTVEVPARPATADPPARPATVEAPPGPVELPDRMPPPIPAALLGRAYRLRSGTAGAEDLADVAGDRGDR